MATIVVTRHTRNIVPTTMDMMSRCRFGELDQSIQSVESLDTGLSGLEPGFGPSANKIKISEFY